MRSRCTVSIFLTRGVCACAERGETCAEASAAVVTAFLARGFRAFFIVASAVIGLASVRLRVGEPAEYALSAKKTQWYWIDSQVPVATGYREPHTDRMPRSEMCLGLKPRMKVYNERIQTRSGRERVYQAAAGRHAACPLPQRHLLLT